MAKKAKKKKTYRRRRIGAAMTASNPLIKYGPIALGFFMADKINKPITEAVGTKLDGKILAAAQGGIGALLVFKGKPSMVKNIAGGILLGSGLKRAMTEFGLGNIGGYGAVPVIGGYGAVPVIGAPRTRRMGSYSPNSQVGAYRVPQSLKVMSGVGSASSSGFNAGAGSSGYMG